MTNSDGYFWVPICICCQLSLGSNLRKVNFILQHPIFYIFIYRMKKVYEYLPAKLATGCRLLTKAWASKGGPGLYPSPAFDSGLSESSVQTDSCQHTDWYLCLSHWVSSSCQRSPSVSSWNMHLIDPRPPKYRYSFLMPFIIITIQMWKYECPETCKIFNPLYDWPSRSNLTQKSKLTPFWVCPHHNSSPIQAKITKFRPKVQNTLVKIPIILWGDWLWPSGSN